MRRCQEASSLRRGIGLGIVHSVIALRANTMSATAVQSTIEGYISAAQAERTYKINRFKLARLALYGKVRTQLPMGAPIRFCARDIADYIAGQNSGAGPDR